MATATMTPQKRAKASPETRPSRRNSHNPNTTLHEGNGNGQYKPAAPSLPDTQMIPLGSIERDDRNHRLDGPENKAKILELQASLGANGLEQPVLVFDRWAGLPKGHYATGKRYILGFGFRRCAAAELNGWKEIAAIVRPAPLLPDGKVDRGPIELARTIENLDRDNLNPIEEGVAVAQLMDALPDDLGGGRFARSAHGPTPAAIEEVASRLGRPAKWIRDRLYFQRLSPKCRKWVAEGKLRLSFAREIAKLADHGAQDHVAGYNLVHDDGACHGNVQRIRAEVAGRLRSLKIAPWQLDAQFPPDKRIVGPCSTCPFNSSNDQPLFEHDRDKPEMLCLKGSCFEAKVSVTNKAAEKAVATIVKKDLPATESSAASVAAEFVKPGRVAREAKKEKASGTPAGRDGDAPNSTVTASSKPAKRTSEEVAKEKLEAALEEWTRESGVAVEQAILNDPRRFAAAAAITFLPPFESAYDMEDKDIEKNADLVKLLVAGDVEAIAARAAESQLKTKEKWNRRIPLFEDGSTDALVEALVAGWKLDVRPKPKLEDFLPAAKPAKTPAAGKPSPRGKKTKAAATVDVGDDDSEEDGALSLDVGIASCRVCGCTEDDCSSCIRATGAACTWVSDDEDPDAMEGDLCSACTPAARRARYDAAAPALGLVAKDKLTEAEYLSLESGNRNTAGRVEGLDRAGLKRFKQLGLVRESGRLVVITEKGLQAIGRGETGDFSPPPPAKAPIQEQTPGIHVSGPMPPETFKLNPADLDGSLSNAATVSSGRIVKVLYLYGTVPFACIDATSGVATPKGHVRHFELHPLIPRAAWKGATRDTPRPDGGLLGLVVTEPGGREYVMGNDTGRVTVVVSSSDAAPPAKVDDFADDGEIVAGSEEQVTTGALVTIRVARTVGGRWLESHKAWVGVPELAETAFAGGHPSRDAAVAAAVDAVRHWLEAERRKAPRSGNTKVRAGDLARTLNTIDKRLTAERARAATKAHEAVVAGGGTLGEAFNAGVAELAST